MNRKAAREFMMKVLFQMEANDIFDINSRDVFFDGTKMGNQKEYCREIFSLACNKLEDIDSLIAKYSTKWSINRIPKTDLAILRLAVIEIKYMDEVPASAAINEAVELSKIYCEDKAPSYINGILGAIVRGNTDE